MRGNPGKICVVTDGIHTGKYLKILNKEQRSEFIRVGKVFGYFYSDPFLNQPVYDSEAPTKIKSGLIDMDKIRAIGCVD